MMQTTLLGTKGLLSESAHFFLAEKRPPHQVGTDNPCGWHTSLIHCHIKRLFIMSTYVMNPLNMTSTKVLCDDIFNLKHFSSRVKVNTGMKNINCMAENLAADHLMRG